MIKPKKKAIINLKEIARNLDAAWGLGFVIAIPAVLVLCIGYFLDKVFKTFPILTIIFIFLSPLAGIAAALKEIKKIVK